MPHRWECREGDAIEINGVPVVVAHARGKRLVAFVAGYDADGLLESAEDCRVRARAYRAKVDAIDKRDNDMGEAE